MTWKDLFNLIFLPFKSCINLIDVPVLEGVSILEVLIAFIVVLLLIKNVVPAANTAIGGSFNVQEAHERELERRRLSDERRDQRNKDYRNNVRFKYSYHRDRNFREENKEVEL